MALPSLVVYSTFLVGKVFKDGFGSVRGNVVGLDPQGRTN
jgi:hypothetical protein